MNRYSGAGVAFLLLVGCGSSLRNEGEHQPELLNRGAETFLKGDYSSAAANYENYLELNPFTTRRAWVFLRVGLCRNGQADYPGAIVAFNRALASGARKNLRIEILYRRAIAYNFSHMPDLALLDLEQICLEPLEARGGVLKISEFERILGVTMIRAGEWKRGRRVLENLARSHPGTPEAASASRLLSFRKFTIQVARYPNEAQARDKISQLEKQGVLSRAEFLPDHSGVSVVVGEFLRYDEAVRERDTLKARGIEGFILP